jgi:hypothetical protein
LKSLLTILSGTALFGAMLLYAPRQAESCGPWFPNHILATSQWETAPASDFRRDLINLGLLPSAAKDQEVEYASDSKTFDLADLTEALGVSSEGKSALLKKYGELRDKVEAIGSPHADQGLNPVDEPQELPSDVHQEIESLAAEGLPAEFARYLQGALRWKKGETAEAMKDWQAVLDLPAMERKHKSTWAAYMLGEALKFADADKAWVQYETVKRLAAAGFKDSASLAHAALGWQGYIALARLDYLKAIDCYLKQNGRGNSIESLRITAAKALDKGSAKDLAMLAADLKARRMITASLTAGGPKFVAGAEEAITVDRLGRWLEALKSADAKDEPLAERIALAAYQQGDMELARSWAELSKQSLASQWILAKLALYDGDVEQAAEILGPLAKKFPKLKDQEAPPGTFADALSLPTDNVSSTAGGKQVWAERGVVELSRKNFVEALDAFMQAGFWVDAAYVAERVLTVDELRTYVDQNSGRLADSSEEDFTQLKGLLASRLMRSREVLAAESYVAPEWKAVHKELTGHLTAGYNSETPREERGEHLLEAAKIIRQHGMELMGSILEPDWTLSGGSYDWGEYSSDRAGWQDILAPSEEEIHRVAASQLPFSRRFHYRFVAAELAWIASKFMPNIDDRTARMLCLAGTWLKYQDPIYAVRFY